MDEGTLKKELRKKIEMSEKICGYVAEEGESENRGQEFQGPQKGPQNF